MKRLAILGSTGSIGQQTLEVVRDFPRMFRVVALTGGKNIELLSTQIEEFKPQMAFFQSDKVSPIRVSQSCQLLSLEEIASHPDVDVVVVATSGKVGLKPALAAIRAGKKVALANKEVLVTAGELGTSEVKRCGAELLPIDSEMSAIWQCLRGERRNAVTRLILTASGGPFYRRSSDELAAVTVEEALKHPTWQMGRKVTIDSATLMNKGMEIIEAHWLFQIPLERIEVVIHPQSVVHSMVEFADGSTKAQLGPRDMRLPIQYALFHPQRPPNPHLPKLDWESIQTLTFERPNWDKFPCLKLAIEAARSGSIYPAVLSAADEVAVELFLGGQIGFLDIAQLIKDSLGHHGSRKEHLSLEDILAADAGARKYAHNWRPR